MTDGKRRESRERQFRSRSGKREKRQDLETEGGGKE